MSYTLENGYSPRTYDNILNELIGYVNTEYGTEYNASNFIGTNLYRLYYPAIQMIMNCENEIGQLVSKLQDYITYINSSIKLPKSTPDGLMNALQDELGVVSSIKPITQEADAGHLDICCDVDPEAEDYDTIKNNIIQKIGKYATTGLYYSGTETGTYTAINGQQFNISYALPTEKQVYVKITVQTSRNSLDFIPVENVVTNTFTDNFNKEYRLGYDFEPDRYLCDDDLPWAASIKVEYNFDNGSSYDTDVYLAAYNEKIMLANVTAEIIDE